MNSDQTILLDSPHEVDVVSIERELVALWKSLTPDDASAPVTRACSLNLVAVAENADAAEELTGIVADVTLEHPSRTFLIVADRQVSTPSITAWISARCSLPTQDGKQVCCEQINLVANGLDAGKIPSIVTSLLVSDVPTVLLWKAPVDPHDAVLTSLVNVADRVLIDSSEDGDPAITLATWYTFIGNNTGRAVFCDLAWTHTHFWRSIVAQIFQPGDMRQHLSSLNKVEIEFSTTRSPRHSGLSQSLLLLGWMAGRLRWNPVHPLAKTPEGEYNATLRVDEHAISVRIVRIPSESGMPGGIERIRLVSADGLKAEVICNRKTSSVQLTTTNKDSTQEECRLLSEEDETELLARELEVLTRDALYEESLRNLLLLMKEPRDARAS